MTREEPRIRETEVLAAMKVHTFYSKPAAIARAITILFPSSSWCPVKQKEGQRYAFVPARSCRSVEQTLKRLVRRGLVRREPHLSRTATYANSEPQPL